MNVFSVLQRGQESFLAPDAADTEAVWIKCLWEEVKKGVSKEELSSVWRFERSLNAFFYHGHWKFSILIG